MQTILEIRNLSAGYGKKLVLNNINISINRNDIVSILGPNGCGKSTLLKSIFKAIDYSGEICTCMNNKATNITQLSSKELSNIISYVPQNHNIAFEFNALDVILMGTYAQSGFFGYAKKHINIAVESMERLHIAHLKDERFSNLSGGQKQMCLIARALAQQSDIILLDEPVSGLDFGNQHQLLELLKSLSNDGKTIIQTTHYPEHAYISNKIVLINNGTIYKIGSNDEVLTPQHLEEIYSIKTTKISLPKGKYYFFVD